MAGNLFVHFSEQRIEANDFRGPDVFVVLDVDGKGRKSWVAWEEGGKLPDVVIEVTSNGTAHVDRGDKMRIHAQIRRTPAYFIFDPDSEEVEGYRLDTARRAYVRLEPDENGDLPVAPLGSKLGLRHPLSPVRTKVRALDRRERRPLADTARARRARAQPRRDRARSGAGARRARAKARGKAQALKKRSNGTSTGLPRATSIR